MNVTCVERAEKNGKETGGPAYSSPKNVSTPADLCWDDKAPVRVRKCEGLDELSWGELEGQDVSQEPWKGKLAALKAAWDSGHFDR